MKTLICIPCMDMIHTGFFRALLNLQSVGEVQFAITQSSLIYDARNILAVQAITGGYDRTLWLDSDMSFDSDMMVKLSKDMDEGRELVSGLYMTRKKPIHPTIYDGVGVFNINGVPQNTAVAYTDYPRDSIFEIEGCGFGGVMVSVPLLKKVREKFGLPFSPVAGFGEDLSFCMRVKNLGEKMYCDSSVKLGHIGNYIYTENDLVRDENVSESQIGVAADNQCV